MEPPTLTMILFGDCVSYGTHGRGASFATCHFFSRLMRAPYPHWSTEVHPLRCSLIIWNWDTSLSNKNSKYYNQRRVAVESRTRNYNIVVASMTRASLFREKLGNCRQGNLCHSNWLSLPLCTLIYDSARSASEGNLCHSHYVLCHSKWLCKQRKSLPQ